MITNAPPENASGVRVPLGRVELRMAAPVLGMAIVPINQWWLWCVSFFSFDWACQDDGAIPAGDASSFPLTTVAAAEAEAKADVFVNAASKCILCFRMISFVSLTGTELFLSLL